MEILGVIQTVIEDMTSLQTFMISIWTPLFWQGPV